MNYVNLMSDERWSEQDHVDAVEAHVRSAVTHTREHVVIRRMFQMLLPLLSGMLPAAPTDGSADPYAGLRAAIAGLVAHCTPITPTQFSEILAAAAAFSAADVLAESARADSARLDLALDYEEARAELAALPPIPVPDPDTGVVPDDTLSPDERAQVERQRADLQATLAAATQDTLDLVAQRDAFRAPPDVPEV